MRVAGAQAATDRQAVLTGQHEIENEQVKGVTRQCFVHRLGVFRDANGKALLAEVALQEIAQSFVVVDDEDLTVIHGDSLAHGRADMPTGARIVTEITTRTRRWGVRAEGWVSAP